MPSLSSSQPPSDWNGRHAVGMYLITRLSPTSTKDMVSRLLERDDLQRFRPRRTCVLPECVCRLASSVSDCHSQVSLEFRHALPRVPGILSFLEIMGSAMSLDPTVSCSCLPPSTPGTPNPRWEIEHHDLAKNSLIVAGSNAGIGHWPLPCCF